MYFYGYSDSSECDEDETTATIDAITDLLEAHFKQLASTFKTFLVSKLQALHTQLQSIQQQLPELIENGADTSDTQGHLSVITAVQTQMTEIIPQLDAVSKQVKSISRQTLVNRDAIALLKQDNAALIYLVEQLRQTLRPIRHTVRRTRSFHCGQSSRPINSVIDQISNTLGTLLCIQGQLRRCTDNINTRLTRLQHKIEQHDTDLMHIQNTMSTGTTGTTVNPNTNSNTSSSYLLGDIVLSYQTSDTPPLYLLDGRPVSSLPEPQKVLCAALGFSEYLPDARNKLLAISAQSSDIGPQPANTFSIETRHMPSFTVSGTTENAGRHSHAYSLGAGSSAIVARRGTYLVHHGRGETSISGIHKHTATVSFQGTNDPIPYGKPARLHLNCFVCLCSTE